MTVPAIVTDSRNPADFITKTSDTRLTFRIDNILMPGNRSITLKPFYEFVSEKHMVYWTLREPGPVTPVAETLYFVDCGDRNVNTVSAGDEFGKYNSVTDQLYGPDPKAGKSWGIVDAPVGGGAVAGGSGTQADSGNGTHSSTGVYTNWTWPLEHGGVVDGSPKEASNRYTIWILEV